LGNSLKWTGIALAVAAGVLVGFALSTFAYRHRLIRVPGPHGFVERLDYDLQLTPDQLHQVQTLMRDTHAKMDQLHEDFERQHQQLIFQTHDKIRELLTPEQQQKFDREFSHPPGDRDRDHEHHDHDG
jgi:Spy/CpxP family protein refolding chaperone